MRTIGPSRLDTIRHGGVVDGWGDTHLPLGQNSAHEGGSLKGPCPWGDLKYARPSCRHHRGGGPDSTGTRRPGVTRAPFSRLFVRLFRLLRLCSFASRAFSSLVMSQGARAAASTGGTLPRVVRRRGGRRLARGGLTSMRPKAALAAAAAAASARAAAAPSLVLVGAAAVAAVPGESCGRSRQVVPRLGKLLAGWMRLLNACLLPAGTFTGRDPLGPAFCSPSTIPW